MKKIIIINGPNLNLLGRREKSVYGEDGLATIESFTKQKLKSAGVELEWFQSNVEGELINIIQKQLDRKDIIGLVINPGGFSHTSVALMDTLQCVAVPVVEVHISQVYRREEFRQQMLTARSAVTVITGAGKSSYYLGVMAVLEAIQKE